MNGYKKRILNFLQNPYNIAFLLMLSFAIYLRFRYLFQKSIWVDETAYSLEALYFMKTGTFGPFTPVAAMRVVHTLIILFWALFFDIFIAGRLMTLTFAVIGTVAIYLLGKEIKNEAVGLLAATWYVFNEYIWFYSSRTLIDVPITSMMIVCAYCLVRLEKQFSAKKVILLVIAIIISTYTKFIGVLFIFIIIFYYILKFILIEKNKKEMLIKILHSKFSYICIFIFILLMYFMRNYYDFFIWGFDENINYNRFFINATPIILKWIICIAAGIGLLFSVLYLKKEYLIILSWAFIIYLAFTFLPAGNYERYILPGCAALIVLAAMGLVELGELIAQLLRMNKKIISAIVILSALIITLPAEYLAANQQIIRGTIPYLGYDEAGAWIKTHVENKASVFVMSTSWANLFSENLHGQINIINTAQFETLNSFMEHIQNISGPVYLIPDIWEAFAQPQWLRPSEENFNAVQQNGFELQHIIYQEYLTPELYDLAYTRMGLFDLKLKVHGVKTPAIFIFKRK